MSRLNDMLDGMTIPEMRRDVSKQENVEWLIRNLVINNDDNKDLGETLVSLLALRKSFMNGSK